MPTTEVIDLQVSEEWRPHLPYLQRCLELARLPGAAVEPNPRVGAVVVHDGRIVGEGAHLRYGGPHAEVHAIAAVANRALLPQSTLYVSLEPCNHHGKTPPCVGLILETGVPHVVVGALDPNPQMQGRSVEALRAHGVRVDVLPDASPFLHLNRHFHTNQRLHRPHILLKWAQSADGFLSAQDTLGRPQPAAISSVVTNRYFHRLRHELQAILIGRNTAVVDNPSLTTRNWPGRDPLRIVLAEGGDLPQGLNLLQGGPTLVVTRERDETVGETRYWAFGECDDLGKLLIDLYQTHKIGSILVEGGAIVHRALMDAGLWDEAIVACCAPVLGAGVPAPPLPTHGLVTETRLGPDQVLYFRNHL